MSLTNIYHHYDKDPWPIPDRYAAVVGALLLLAQQASSYFMQMIQ